MKDEKCKKYRKSIYSPNSQSHSPKRKEINIRNNFFERNYSKSPVAKESESISFFDDQFFVEPESNSNF